ncbi:MAG: putative baseplate assembly protein [Isosphaeraceae bacterium]
MTQTEPNLTCGDPARRAKVLEDPVLNGLDYVEVPPESLNAQRFPRVFFLKSPPPAGLVGQPHRVRVEGGVRIRDLNVLSVTAEGDHLVVEVDRAGDFSTYVLRVDHPEIDPTFASLPFSFKAGCPSRLDCRPDAEGPDAPEGGPAIDYLAKDYASFRRALLDRLAVTAPDWQERHAADLGVALVELLAYAADHLSYYQDAVANEATLATARSRVSVRRHARLVDYAMHDGASARALVHLSVATAGTLPKGARVLSRIDVPLASKLPPHGPSIPPRLTEAALDAAATVFETTADAFLHPALNERISIHTWGNCRCCIPAGTTSVDLVDREGAFAAGSPADWLIRPGDLLILGEVRGPTTGLPDDADLSNRQAVRLVEVQPVRDELLKTSLVRVRWDRADALTFPLCLSSVDPDGNPIADISMAWANLATADHGRTLPAEVHPGPRSDVPAAQRLAHRFRLDRGPLSFRVEPPAGGPARDLMRTDPHEARPQVLRVEPQGGGEVWRAVVPDLLASGPFDPDLVVETEDDGRALIRFGDGRNGLPPPDDTPLAVTYRVGVGTSGNVGPGALAHVVSEGLPVSVTAVENPLAAWGGVEPESVTAVRRLAPQSLHAQTDFAVTEEDYARVAERHPDVARAVATFRWTGSWHTVFVAVDPNDRTDLPPEMRAEIKAWVERFAQAGYDVEVDPPVFVPLEIEAEVCVARGYFAGQVEEAVLTALSDAVMPDGGRGFFHPDQFTFGQSLHLSDLYAAITAVEGVDSAEVTVFRRLGRTPLRELELGRVPAGRLEILRLDNDPSFPENGQLRLVMRGGS